MYLCNIISLGFQYSTSKFNNIEEKASTDLNNLILQRFVNRCRVHATLYKIKLQDSDGTPNSKITNIITVRN